MALLVTIKATNTELTDLMRTRIEEKVRTLEKFISPDDTSATAAVDVGRTTERHNTGDVYYADVSLHIAGKDFYAKAERADVYAAVDAVKDTLSNDVKRHRGKQSDLVKKGGRMFKNILRRFGMNADNEL